MALSQIPASTSFFFDKDQDSQVEAPRIGKAIDAARGGFSAAAGIEKDKNGDRLPVYAACPIATRVLRTACTFWYLRLAP